MNSNARFPLLFEAAMLVCLLLFSFFPQNLTATTNPIPFSQSEREYLVGAFLSEQFEGGFLEAVFNDSKLRKYPVVVTKNVYNKENKRNYEDFTNPYSLKKAKRFQKKWRTLLDTAADKFEVDKEILVAILLVETGLGNVLGKFPVISVFSSILVEHQAYTREFAAIQEPTDEQTYVLERLSIKAVWAEQEMAALLKIVKQTKQSPFNFVGSYAGAFGIPQFLPSSYVKWGFDSDNNGSVNLFLVPDAIYSTANYLKAHGWKKGLYLESNKDVLYSYNNSDVYVETVLNIAKKIKNSHLSDSNQAAEQTMLEQSQKSRNKDSTS